MQKSTITVRIAALTTESRAIRLAERHHLANARQLMEIYPTKHAKSVEPPKPPELTDKQKAKLAKVKEAGNIKKFAQDSYDAFWNLQDRRKNIIRRQARHHLVALGFLRGRPFNSIEQQAYSAPNWAEVEGIVLMHHEGPRNKDTRLLNDIQGVQQKFEQWLQEAKAHFKNKGNLNVTL